MIENAVATHYFQGNLIDSILKGLEQSGKNINNVTVDDLGPVDEFHTGGRAATEHLLAALQISSGNKVLDIGCGIGGTSRFMADRFNVNVHGVDLTPEYIETGRVLNSWVSLDNEIELQCDNATSLTSEKDVFDFAVMLHVGMNVKDKSALFSEVVRVLKQGGRFAIYDVMQKEPKGIQYPSTVGE